MNSIPVKEAGTPSARREILTIKKRRNVIYIQYVWKKKKEKETTFQQKIICFDEFCSPSQQ